MSSIYYELFRTIFPLKSVLYVIDDVNTLWNKMTRKPIQDVKKAFKTACSRAGIEDLRFHDLRHTFATRLIESGVDILTVSELLGHSTIKMTMCYSHPTPVHKRNAVDILVKTGREKSVEILPEMLRESSSELPNGQIMHAL